MDAQRLGEFAGAFLSGLLASLLFAFRVISAMKTTRTQQAEASQALQTNVDQRFTEVLGRFDNLHDRLNQSQQDRIADLSRTLDAYGAQLKEITTQQTITLGNNAALRKDIDGFKEVIAHLQTQLDAAKVKINEQEAQINALDKAAAAFRTRHDTQIAQYEAKLVEDGRELHSRQQTIEALTAQLTEANLTVARMTDRLNALEVEVKQLNTRVLELEATLVTAQEALKQATAERDALQRKLIQTETERDQANALVAEHTRQIAALTEQLDTLRAQLATMQGSEQVKG